MIIIFLVIVFSVWGNISARVLNLLRLNWYWISNYPFYRCGYTTIWLTDISFMLNEFKMTDIFKITNINL